MGLRGTVLKTALAVLQPPLVPLAQALPAEADLDRDMNLRPAGFDPLTEPTAPFNGQRGITV